LLFKKSELILIGIVSAGVLTVLLALKLGGTACVENTEACSPLQVAAIDVGFIVAIGSIIGYLMYVEESKRLARRKLP